MRDKLIELMYSAMLTRENDRLMYGEARLTFEELADYLIDHGVNVCTSGEYLPREETIKGVLEQMQASSHPKCMEEFLRNLNGVTVTDTNVFGKWIPVKERLPERTSDYMVYLSKPMDGKQVPIGRGVVTYITADERWAIHYPYIVTHWMPLPESPKEVE